MDIFTRSMWRSTKTGRGVHLTLLLGRCASRSSLDSNSLELLSSLDGHQLQILGQ